MRNRATLALTIVVLCAGVWAFYQLSADVSRGGERVPLYASERYDPYGTAALYHLLSERLPDVRRLERPRLPDDFQGTLVQVLAQPDPDDWFSDEASPNMLPTTALLDWVAQGNTVVQLTRSQTELMDALNIVIESAGGLSTHAVDHIDAGLSIQRKQRKGAAPDKLPGSLETAYMAEDAPAELRMKSMVLHKAAALSSTDAHWQPLAKVNSHRVVAGEFRHGSGRVIIVSAPTPALNHWLGEAGNLVFMLYAVGDGAVLFDEWSHGIGHAGTVIQLIRQMGLTPMLCQLALLVLVYRWRTRGSVSTPQPAAQPVRSIRDQISTLGHLYRQSLSAEECVRRVNEEVRRRLADALRCKVDAIEEHLNKSTTEPAERARDLLAQLQTASLRYQPRCTSCGYNLTASTSQRCPECDAWIPLMTRQRIEAVHAAATAARPKGSQKPSEQTRPSHGRDLTRFLSVSHQIAKDLRRA